QSVSLSVRSSGGNAVWVGHPYGALGHREHGAGPTFAVYVRFVGIAGARRDYFGAYGAGKDPAFERHVGGAIAGDYWNGDWLSGADFVVGFPRCGFHQQRSTRRGAAQRAIETAQRAIETAQRACGTAQRKREAAERACI